MKTDIFPKFLVEIFLAFALLTRLPIPRLPESAFDRTGRAVWAYPLVGAVLGGLAVLVGTATLAAGLPVAIAAALALITIMVTSGAMHEDGLADVADGFWGGQTQVRRLEIMKDSQIGTYGTLALICIVGVRWIATAGLLVVAPASIVVCAVASRASMPFLMNTLPHARDNGLSHSVGRPQMTTVLAGMALALVISIVLVGTNAALVVLVATAVPWLIKPIAHRKINGQTGDVLGATQQISETVALCALLAAMT